MRLTSIFSGFAISIALIGCASSPPGVAYYPSEQTVDYPAIGAEATAEVGQTMIRRARVRVHSAVRVDSDVYHSMMGKASGKITVYAGVHRKKLSNDEGDYYSNSSGSIRYSDNGATVTFPTGIFVPSDKNKPARTYYFSVVDNVMVYGEPVRVTQFEEEVIFPASFKQELVYSGLSQRSISISYREFKDDFARPAFSQELRYDLADGDVIGFRGSRFQVIKAGNTEIRYKVLKSLE